MLMPPKDMERRLKREKRMAERMNQMAEIEEAAKGGGGDRIAVAGGAEEEDGEEPERQQQAKRILERIEREEEEDQVRTARDGHTYMQAFSVMLTNSLLLKKFNFYRRGACKLTILYYSDIIVTFIWVQTRHYKRQGLYLGIF